MSDAFKERKAALLRAHIESGVAACNAERKRAQEAGVRREVRKHAKRRRIIEEHTPESDSGEESDEDAAIALLESEHGGVYAPLFSKRE